MSVVNSSSDSTGGGHLDIGAIVGIAIGGFTVVNIALVLIMGCCRTGRRKKYLRGEKSGMITEHTNYAP